MKNLGHITTLTRPHLLSKLQLQGQCLQRRYFFDKISEFFSKKENHLFQDVSHMMEELPNLDVLPHMTQWTLHDDKDYGGTSECLFQRGYLSFSFFLPIFI